MSEVTIDRLQIEIEAQASKGSKGIEQFIKSIEKLKSLTIGGTQGLSKLQNDFENLNKSIQPLTDKLKNISVPLEKLKSSINGLGNTDIGALKIQAEVARLQASLDRSALSSARAKVGIEKLEIANRKAAESASYRAQAEKDLDDIIKKTIQSQENLSNLKSVLPNNSEIPKTSNLATSITDLKNSIEGSAKQIEEATQRANEAFYKMDGSAGAALDNINAKIELQRLKLIQLNQTYLQAVNEFGSESSQAFNIQGKIVGIEGVINNLVARSDKLAESLRNVEDAAKSTTQELRALQLSSSQTEDLTITLDKLDSIREAQSLKNLSSEYENATKKITDINKEMKGKNKTLRDQTNATKQETSAIGNWINSLGKVLKRVVLVSIAYKALKETIKFVSDGIKSAISAPEIENMFNVAFGSLAYEADMFAQKLKKAFGVDVIASKQMLATFQNFNVSMGIGANTATKMSKSLTQLAYDMASLNESDPQKVFENLQSGLQGMPRALYKYGISITDANIKQTAFRYGIGATGRELTSQEKIVARYITILEQTKTSQGDLERTLQSPSNQLRIFQSQMVAAGRAIGEAFMPFVQAVLPWLNTLAVLLERVGYAIASFTYGLFGRNFAAEMKKKQEDLKGMQNIIGGIGDAQDGLADSTKKAAKETKSLISGFDELNILQKQNQDFAGSGATGGGGFEFDVPTLPEPEGLSVYEKMADDILKIISSIFQSIKDFWDKYFAKPFADAWAKIEPQLKALQKTFEKIFNDILTLAEPIANWFFGHAIPMLQQLIETGGDVLAGLLESINMVISDVWDALFPMIKSFIELALPAITDFVTETIKTFGTLFQQVKKIFDSIWSDAIKPVLDLISQIWQDLMMDIKILWDEWGATTFENIRAAIENLGEFFLKLWGEFLKPIFGEIVSVLGTLWEEHLNPLVQKIGDFALAFVNAALEIYNEFISPIVKWIIETFYPPVAGAINDIISIVGDLLGFIIDVASGIIDAFKGVVDFVVGVFTSDWERAWKGIQEYFSGIWEIISNVFSGVIATIQNLWDTFSSWISASWNTVWSSISTFFSGIWEGISQTAITIVGIIKKTINDFLDGIKTVWTTGWNAVKNTFILIWNAIKDFISPIIETISGWIDGLINSVKGAIDWVKNLLGLNKEAKETMPVSSPETNSQNRSSARSEENSNNNFRNIPAFANGGVVREPTYALVGEYQNARSDPEVIAPQSTIKESVVAANGELVGALYQMATMIVQAIEDNATEVQQDPDAMFKVIRKKATNYKRNTGSPAF